VAGSELKTGSRRQFVDAADDRFWRCRESGTVSVNELKNNKDMVTLGVASIPSTISNHGVRVLIMERRVFCI